MGLYRLRSGKRDQQSGERQGYRKVANEHCRGLLLLRCKRRFFLWRQSERIVAFAVCMVYGDAIYAEYVGFDYDVALDLHLYHYAFRDMVSWAIANGYKWFRSSGLNYDHKLHLRHLLDPIDLYVRHTSVPINKLSKGILPVIEPTRYDETLAMFRNYHELWAPSRDGSPSSVGQDN